MMALARTVTLLVAVGTACARAADIGYLAPPGVPAKEFPSPRRPVASIVSPSRSAEEHRDSLNEAGEIARLLALKPGMTVGDVGAGSGYHTVRLSRLLGPHGVRRRPRRHAGLPRRARQANGTLEADKRHVRAGRTARPAPARFLAGCRNPRAHVSRGSPTLCIPLQSRARLEAGRARRNSRPRASDLAAWHANCALALRADRRRLSRDRHISARRRWRIPGGVFCTGASGSKIAPGYRCLWRWCRHSLITAPDSYCL